jgi:predicted permease
MADELRMHIDEYAEDLMRSGMPAGEARRRARAEFGSMEAIMEDCRRSRGLQHLDELRQDVGYAVRQMTRSPVFAGAAVVSLALGIGANTAIFSVMEAVLWRSLAIRSPDALYYLGHTGGTRVSTSSNYPLFERYQESAIFEGVAAYEDHIGFQVAMAEGVEHVNGQYVSGNYHFVVGVPMRLGRGFTAERDREAGASPIAVIGDGYWQRRYGRDPDVIGRSLTVNGRVVTIVGVTVPGFNGLSPGSVADLTLPMSMRALDEPDFFDARDGWVSLSLVVRLASGTNATAALAAAGPVFERFWMEPENEWARRDGNAAARTAALIPAGKGSGGLRARYGTALRVLMGMVAIVLLIACVNVANLQLARATARSREVTVRLSIGAGRSRLVRQFLTESCLLALFGGLFGLLVAMWSVRALLSFFDKGQFPVLVDVTLNGRVLLFTAGVSLLTGVMCGLMPALRATRRDLMPGMSRYGRLPGKGREWVAGRLPVAVQIALCMLLVTAAGLLVRSVRNLNTVDAGFARDNLLLFNVETGEGVRTTEQRLAYHALLVEGLRRLPGVETVALAKRSPVDFSTELRRIVVPGVPEPAGPSGVSSNTITPDYFRALGIALVRGRSFTDQDRDGSGKVAVVSESMATAWFGTADALGRSIVMGGNQDTMSIVGIVRDARHEGIRADAPRSVYTPLAQPGESFDGSTGIPARLTALVRTSGDPGLLASAATDHVRNLGAGAIVSWVRTMRQQLDAAHLRELLLARLATAFGVLALLLAIAGLHGVMSYEVARRSRDMGIRMALGATRRQLMTAVLRQVLVLALAGIAAGTGLAMVSTRVIAAYLFGLSPGDAETLAVVASFLLATVLLAGYFPARSAAAADPIRTMRTE